MCIYVENFTFMNSLLELEKQDWTLYQSLSFHTRDDDLDDKEQNLQE